MLTWRRYGKKIIFLKVAALLIIRIFFVTGLGCAEPFVDGVSLSDRRHLRAHLLGNSDIGKSRLKDGLALIPLSRPEESNADIKILIKAKINEILGNPHSKALTINRLNQLKEHFDKLSPGQKNTFTRTFWETISYAAGIHMRHEKLVPQDTTRPSILIAAVSNALDLVVTFTRAPDGKLEISNIEQMDAGGKSINVAKGLSKFGAKVKIMGFKGHGEKGEEFIKFLDNYGLDADFLETGADTRVSLFFISKEGDFEIRYRSPGEAISHREVFGFFDHFFEFLKDAETGQFLITGGRIPFGADYSIFLRVIREAEKRGLNVIFDFSDTLTQKDMKSILKAHPYLIKPDLEEFAKITGRDESELRGNYGLIAQEAQKLAKDYNIEIVLVSMDKDGAILVKDDLVLLAAPPKIKPLSTVGAGDALITGLVYKLNSGASIEEALYFAVAAGTATCLKPGIKIADLEEVDRLFGQVTVKRYDTEEKLSRFLGRNKIDSAL
ncbi:MAG: PfkB family carbohydrate kinase [Candidatus Omnitrophota bacterium]|nr:PfkB family carbohydrate kinase [Candidatus Omnitrophota bacterium]